jgi:hypothetical protein
VHSHFFSADNTQAPFPANGRGLKSPLPNGGKCTFRKKIELLYYYIYIYTTFSAKQN